MTKYEWSPLTDAETEENSGMAALRREAKANPIAALVVKRIDQAMEALEPEIARMKAEFERQFMEPSGPPSGLSLLLGEEKSK